MDLVSGLRMGISGVYGLQGLRTYLRSPLDPPSTVPAIVPRHLWSLPAIDSLLEIWHGVVIPLLP